MGLYDDRLSDLSESRRTGRVAQRRSSSIRPTSEAAMSAQSLLFDRSAGWTVSKAKAWAKSHGYRYGKVDVTDQYVRLRQFDPKGFKVKRTIPFGRGIRAVVAREDSMRTTVKATSRRRRAKSTKKRARRAPKRAAPKRARRRVKKVAAVATRRRRRVARVETKRSRRRRPARSSHVMEAKRKAPRRRRRVSRASEAWRGDSAGHATAARKGHRRRKAASAAPKRRKRRKPRKARETTYAAAPRRRRRKAHRAHSPMVMEAKRTRRRYHAHAKSRSSGMSPGALALMVGAGGLGFVLADGLDRMLATYDPSSTDPKPTDKFTSDGAGTLANTLNVAAMPNWKRLVAGVGITAAPAVGAMFVDNSYGRGALEGLAVGAGINLFKTLWNNVLMPMLVGKDTSPQALQKSYIARLYPAEVAAHINQKKTDDSGAARTPQMAVTSAGSGALSDQPAAGVGAPDVGPFALSGDSPYADAAQALRTTAGVQDQFPSLQNAWGTGGPGSDHPTAAQAMGTGAPAGHGNPGQPGLSYQPGPPPGPGPGPQAAPHTDPSCGCIGELNPFLGFVGEEVPDNAA